MENEARTRERGQDQEKFKTKTTEIRRQKIVSRPKKMLEFFNNGQNARNTMRIRSKTFLQHIVFFIVRIF